MTENVNSSKEENIVSIELTNHFICHIHLGGPDLRRNEVSIIIAHAKTRVAVFTIRTSREFLNGAHYVMETAAKSFSDRNEVDATKTVVKVNKGMCKVSGMIRPDTKIKHSFPVNDEISWGKTTLTIKDWFNIIEELNMM